MQGVASDFSLNFSAYLGRIHNIAGFLSNFIKFSKNISISLDVPLLKFPAHFDVFTFTHSFYNGSIKVLHNLYGNFGTIYNKSKRKRNFIIYHFLVNRKPHERIYLLITASVNIYQKKNPLVMKTCFSDAKLMKQFGNPPLSKRTCPFQLTPLFLSNFFMTTLFVQISETRNPL